MVDTGGHNNTNIMDSNPSRCIYTELYRNTTGGVAIYLLHARTMQDNIYIPPMDFNKCNNTMPCIIDRGGINGIYKLYPAHHTTGWKLMHTPPEN